MSLEDIFINIVDTTDKPVSAKDSRKRTRSSQRGSMEQDFAASVIKKTADEQRNRPKADSDKDTEDK